MFNAHLALTSSFSYCDLYARVATVALILLFATCGSCLACAAPLLYVPSTVCEREWWSCRNAAATRHDAGSGRPAARRVRVAAALLALVTARRRQRQWRLQGCTEGLMEFTNPHTLGTAFMPPIHTPCFACCTLPLG